MHESHRALRDVPRDEPRAAGDESHHRSGDDVGADHRTDADGHRRTLSPPRPESRAVPPCRELRAERLADAYEFGAVLHSRETDLVGRRAKTRPAVDALGIL